MKKNRTRRIIFTLFIIIAILCALVFLWLLKNPKNTFAPVNTPGQAEIVTDSIMPKQILQGETDSPDLKKPVANDTRSKRDSLVPRAADTINVTNPCAGDTITVWVYADPSGGLHRGAIAVSLVTDPGCRVFYRRLGIDTGWTSFEKTPLAIAQSTAFEFFAVDSCGKRSDSRQETYEISSVSVLGKCPAGMEYITVSQAQFCVDRYEWPNKKGVVPTSYVSIYAAMDSCASAGKRLCLAEEWQIACSGRYSVNYPYGNTFEPRACVTSGIGHARTSGSAAECRGYFDVYDMSGNLAEWTSTKSPENRDFYKVMGGFWESGIQSSCTDSRYSYFPQNRHNPVGFRCCKESTK